MKIFAPRACRCTLPLVVFALMVGCASTEADTASRSRWQAGWRQGVVTTVSDQPTLGPSECGGRIEAGTRFFTVKYRSDGRPHWVSRKLSAQQAIEVGQAVDFNLRTCEWISLPRRDS